MEARWSCVDGNEAAARAAHALSEVVALHPIISASPMGEHADATDHPTTAHTRV